MTTEQYLEQVYEADKRIRDLLIDLSRFKQDYERDIEPYRGVNYDVVIQKSRVNTSPVEKAVILLVDKHGRRIGEIESEITGWEIVKADVLATVDRAGLTKEEREYIRLRYFKGLKTARIQKEIHYARRQCYRIRDSALKKVCDMMAQKGTKYVVR